MRITIELNDAQVKGLKSYLKEVSSDVNPKITKKDIAQEIQGIVSSNLQTGAVADHIMQQIVPENTYQWIKKMESR